MSRPEPRPRLALISPVRDEAGTFGCTLASVLAQQRRPQRWVLVDDGSAAPTRRLLERAAAEHDFVSLVRLADRGRRQPGPGVVRAIEAGLQRLDDFDWDFLGKLDGDVQLPPEYYARVLAAFAAEPELGIAAGACLTPAGGGWRREANAPFHTRGPCKVWRRACFEAIGGLEPVLGWDGLDGYRARQRGFRTRTLDGLEVLHFRPTHAWEGRWRGGLRSGRGAYNQHFRPAYLLARAAVHLLRPPYLVGGLGIAAGYFGAWLRRSPRPADAELVAFIHREQGARLRRLLSGRGDLRS